MDPVVAHDPGDMNPKHNEGAGNGRRDCGLGPEQQLGLRLEMRKRPMPVLVIDRIAERPMDN